MYKKISFYLFLCATLQFSSSFASQPFGGVQTREPLYPSLANTQPNSFFGLNSSQPPVPAETYRTNTQGPLVYPERPPVYPGPSGGMLPPTVPHASTFSRPEGSSRASWNQLFTDMSNSLSQGWRAVKNYAGRGWNLTGQTVGEVKEEANKQTQAALLFAKQKADEARRVALEKLKTAGYFPIGVAALISGAGIMLAAQSINAILGVYDYYKPGCAQIEELMIKNMINVVLNNPLVYPTRAIKIYALNNINQILVGVEDKNGIIAKSCKELIQEFSTSQNAQIQQFEANIDNALQAKENDLARFSLQEKIHALEQDSKMQQMDSLLRDPQVRANLSLLSRLKTQQEIQPNP